MRSERICLNGRQVPGFAIGEAVSWPTFTVQPNTYYHVTILAPPTWGWNDILPNLPKSWNIDSTRRAPALDTSYNAVINQCNGWEMWGMWTGPPTTLEAKILDVFARCPVHYNEIEPTTSVEPSIPVAPAPVPVTPTPLVPAPSTPAPAPAPAATTSSMWPKILVPAGVLVLIGGIWYLAR